MYKSQIALAAKYGGRFSPHDVARVSRDGTSITLRHCWNDDTDGRVVDAVRRAYMELAREQAERIRKAVQIYDPRGWMIEQVEWTWEPES
jgi:hypothetical protein